MKVQASINQLAFDSKLLGESVNEFLINLGTTSAIFLRGEHRGPKRALATLLHGNEPSGINALWSWLKRDEKPYADTLIIVGNIAAALAPPGFAYRHLDQQRDMNRCFDGPVGDRESQIAHEIIKVIEDFKPACLVDIHNTSGVGPAFGVTTRLSKAHETLTTYFCEKLILTDIRLGALMNVAESICPTVTIECGGAIDQYADQVAAQGLVKYLNSPLPLDNSFTDIPLEVIRLPVRLELVAPHTINYGSGAGAADVVLRSDVEQFNFGTIRTDQALGWLGSRGLRALKATTDDGRDVLDQLLMLGPDREILPARPLKLFMVTPNPQAARDDCLFYAVRDDGLDW